MRCHSRFFKNRKYAAQTVIFIFVFLVYLYHRAFPEIEEEVVVLKVNSTDTIVYTITHAAVRIAAPVRFILQLTYTLLAKSAHFIITAVCEVCTAVCNTVRVESHNI